MKRLSLMLCCILSFNVYAIEDYPSKPIEIVIGLPASSGHANMVDIIKDKIPTPSFKLIRKHRVGQGNMLAYRYLATAPADGYTIGFTSTSVVANQTLFKEPGYNTDNFTPLIAVGKVYNGLVINSHIPFSSIKQIIKYAKNNPESFTYGHNGYATQGFLALEKLAIVSGVKFKAVPYKGTSFAAMDVMSGFIDSNLFPTTQLVNFLPNNKLKLIAMTSVKRHPNWPNTPTIAETYPGFSSSIWFMIQIRKEVPDNIKNIIKENLLAAINNNETQILLKRLGLIAFETNETNNLELFQKNEIKSMNKLIDNLIKNGKYERQ